MKDTAEFSDALNKTKQLRESYGDALKDNPEKSLEYFAKLIELADNNELYQREACFLIADTMWYPSVNNNPGLEAIATDAGELELPDELIDGKRNDRWARLKAWVKEETDNLKNKKPT